MRAAPTTTSNGTRTTAPRSTRTRSWRPPVDPGVCRCPVRGTWALDTGCPIGVVFEAPLNGERRHGTSGVAPDLGVPIQWISARHDDPTAHAGPQPTA